MSLQARTANGCRSDHDRRSGHFKRGNRASNGAARKARIAKLTAQLADRYDATGAAATFIAVAAAALDQASRARTSVVRARAARSAAKAIGLLQRKPEPALDVMAMLERARHG
jgi:hypothetical protein